MKTVKVIELTGAALDWAVQQCEGARKDIDFVWWTDDHYSPSTDWKQGGPIIEREGLCLIKTGTTWQCTTNGNALHSHAKEGSIALIAAMRCYVASKLGDAVEVPEELL